MTDALASLRGVVRRFGSVTALAGADLEVRGGEVHGVLGENGAGKTTLLGVLGGMLRPDEGVLEIRGKGVELSGPRAAWQHGVGLVHQHFTLVPALTVLENLALGRDPGVSGRRRPLERVRSAAVRLSDRTGLTVPLEAAVEDLGVGERQRVEILKALLREPPILVLDEPTAVLTPGEVESLFDLLRELAAEGKAVVLVAHKIDEVLAVSDRITVLRRGRTVLTAERGQVDAPSLIRAMVGTAAGSESDVTLDVAEAVGAPVEGAEGAARAAEARTPEGLSAPPVARLSRARTSRADGSVALHDVSLAVHRREIVGIAGVEGNGQRELALVLAGRLPVSSGEVALPPGIGFIPQDRTAEGLVSDFDLVENTALALHDDGRFTRGPWLDWREVRAEAQRVVSRFGVVTPGVEARAGALSGGNQQRMIAGRELIRASDLLVAENPTRGLDVAATAFVHAELRRLAGSESGPGIVLVSTDLDEVLSLSTRILVMVRGRLTMVPEGRRSREGVGALMLSGEEADA